MNEQSEPSVSTTSRITSRMVMQVAIAVVLLLYVAMVLAQVGVRFVSPSLFAWGTTFLPSGHGVANTIVLILSCVPIAMARHTAARTNRWVMIAALSATFLGGVVFLAVQSVEYETSFRQGLGWGAPVNIAGSGGGGAIGELGPGDVGLGNTRWQATCRSCHGPGGEGVEGQGKDLRQSSFVQGLDDPGLIAFIKAGRPVSDPVNATGKPMPPKGGNPLLKDAQLMDIVAYIRTIQVPISDVDEEDETAVVADDIAPLVKDEEAITATAEANDGFWIPSSSVPLAALGPTGLSPDAFTHADRPARADLFFGFFFLMTGMHILQMLMGLVILMWLIYRAVQIPYTPSRDVPVDLAGRYWYFAVAIWVALFPLFYFT